MPTTVLVTWATRYGSTEEVAHAIADDLLKQKFAVTAQPMSEVGSLERYQAVVMGFALYIGRIHKDARHFLVAHRVPARCSAPSPSSPSAPCMPKKRNLPTRGSSWRKNSPNFPGSPPLPGRSSGADSTRRKLRFPFTFLPVLRNVPASDARDWDAIHAWAGNLPSTLVAAPMR